MRPVGEPTASYGTTWVPDYLMFEPKIDYFGPLRMELFHATNKLLNAERSSSEYKYVPYEIARDEMKSFLTKNGLTVNLLVQPRYLFFMKELFPEDPAIVAYNAIYANMNAIKTTDPDLCKHPIILALLTEHKKILGYLTNEPLKAELTELTKGGKNIKKRYAKNTKGRRRQVSRQRKNVRTLRR